MFSRKCNGCVGDLWFDLGERLMIVSYRGCGGDVEPTCDGRGDYQYHRDLGQPNEATTRATAKNFKNKLVGKFKPCENCALGG